MSSRALGRVFLRRPAAAQAEHTLSALGGRPVYAADITLNGGDGRLRVYAFERPLVEVGRDLEEAFGIHGLADRGASMALATARLRGLALRFIVVDLTGGRQTLVFAVEQTEREFAASKSPPGDGAVGGIPAYPGSRPLFKAEDNNTGMALAVSSSRAAAATVREFYRSRLHSDGWEDAIPPASENSAAGGPARDPALIVYLKPAEFCCVLAQENGFPDGTRITIVHKTARMD